jgi:predicted DNA-binding transcriptional regulator AlpA
MPNENRLLTNAEAAHRLGLRPNSLAVMRSRGTLLIPYHRVGRLIRYDPADIDHWIQQQHVEPIAED